MAPIQCSVRILRSPAFNIVNGLDDGKHNVSQSYINMKRAKGKK